MKDMYGQSDIVICASSFPVIGKTKVLYLLYTSEGRPTLGSKGIHLTETYLILTFSRT